MKQKFTDFADFKKKLLKKPAVKREYDLLEPEFSIIRAVLAARINKGVTQKDLAERMGTKQSVISRLEKGKTNPTIDFIQKLSTALNTPIHIQINPQV